jgi:hypothetical protein
MLTLGRSERTATTAQGSEAGARLIGGNALRLAFGPPSEGPGRARRD